MRTKDNERNIQGLQDGFFDGVTLRLKLQVYTGVSHGNGLVFVPLECDSSASSLSGKWSGKPQWKRDTCRKEVIRA
jgi:hypothetical protein